ncbi:twin-arginine translocation signal domain-containing protein [Streptomyces sp. NBC_01022]|uniref:twin-arginine translocation signal domain-containing protein n=1 Tax=Streptomyces sp. NBC_01022 TaxID=2903723 RepID=UPI002DDC6704|nr:twin-arginine translocation signal domain-containing protein [Streptomyces sp. NBC_01022]WRZ86150.1 helix-turn-helix domain-containing protein [Streptomyces sp. NBC_01022]
MMTPDGIGALLRGRRERAGLTREEQADLLSAAQGGRWFDPENLKRWETEKRLPVGASHRVIAQAYGLSAEAVTAAVGASRRFRNMTQAEQEDEVNRRGFLGAVAAAGITASVPSIAQAREGIDQALGHAGIDGDLAYLEAAFERHRGGYNGRAPDRVLADMAADVGLLREVMSRPHPARDRADLARTAAGIAGLVAIIQHDRGDERDAYGWFTTAEKAARESGDTSMRAWVLARHAMVPLNYHAPAAAARLAATARRAAGLQPTAAGALAAAVSARALAALGDQRGATRAIADARNLAEHLDPSGSADTWFGYPEQKHLVHLSQAYTLLGDTKAAYGVQEEARVLTRSPSVMTRALLAVDTAVCLHTDGDSTGAADMAAAVYDRLPAPYRQGLIRSRAMALHERLDGRARTLLGDALA